MNYPLISEYIEAIKAAEDNLNQLSYLRPVLNGDGQPVMSSGNFAVVFKMKDEQTGKLHALKCFLKEQEGRAEAYKQITKELENVSSTFLTPIKYYEHELFVDSKATKDIEFPVLLMDWVEGVPLDKYVRDHIGLPYELELLTWNFKLMATWLLEQPFAHGDLKPDNIIVRDDGTMVLVDYDGMFVPAMEGQCARELGSPDFRHPQRTEQDFNKRIDDFPIVSIVLSLKAIALEPELLERYGAKDRLLFSEADYRELGNCRFVKDYFPSQSPELDMLYALFLMVWRDSKQVVNTISPIMEEALIQPVPPIEDNYLTKRTDEDRANAWKDEYGAVYSTDKKRLLGGPKTVFDYRILKGTLAIVDNAFYGRDYLQSVTIPNSVTQIGDGAFQCCYDLNSIVIPNSVTKIGKCAFYSCSELQSILIPNSVTQIGSFAFLNCGNLQSIAIPDSVTQIGDGTFQDCHRLQSIVIPDSVKQIGDGAFQDCHKLQSIVIPDSVTRIGNAAFGFCENLQSMVIPNSVTEIGEEAFKDCIRLQSIAISESVTQIGRFAFLNCSSLQSIVIPDSVTEIGDSAFSGCENLQSIVIPESITKISDKAFFSCKSIQSIVIPDSVKQIGDGAFYWCDNLRSIVIPKGSKEKFQELLPDYKHLLREQ